MVARHRLTGAVRTHGRTSAVTEPIPGPFLTTNNPGDGDYIYSMVSIGYGPYSGPEGTFATGPSATPQMATAAWGDALSFGDGAGNSGGTCLCRCANASMPTTSTAYVSPEAGLHTNMLGGYIDPALQINVSPGIFPKIDDIGSAAILEFGWDPDRTWKALGKLSKTSQSKLQALLDAGWKFATDSDGTASIGKLEGDNDNVRLDVKNEEWLDWLADGDNDGQWVGGKWGVSFESKLIYLDIEDNDEAAQVLHDLMSAIDSPDPKDAAKYILDTNLLGGVWATFMGMADVESEWKAICGKIKEKRLMSLLGSLSLDGLRYVADYLKDHFSVTNLVIGGAAGLVGMAAAVKLYKVIKNIRALRGIASKIAKGHAWTKHAKEFKGITSQDAFAKHIKKVMVSGKSQTKALQRGRKAYYDKDSNTIVITDPSNKDGGTAFKPKKGQAYFDGLE